MVSLARERDWRAMVRIALLAALCIWAGNALGVSDALSQPRRTSGKGPSETLGYDTAGRLTSRADAEIGLAS